MGNHKEAKQSRGKPLEIHQNHLLLNPIRNESNKEGNNYYEG